MEANKIISNLQIQEENYSKYKVKKKGCNMREKRVVKENELSMKKREEVNNIR